MSRIKIIIIAILGIILSVVSAFAYVNYSLNKEARQELRDTLIYRSPVVGVNDELLVFTEGQAIESTNIEQKALGRNGEVSRPAKFVFGSKKVDVPKKTVKAYLDFSEQRSRDFILLNQDLLQGLIEGGVIQLEVYSIPTGKGFSIFSSEALAESFVTDPESSWSYFIKLMKASAELESNVNAEDMVKRIAELSDSDEIDEDSIWNGSFTSWLLTVSEDPFLRTGVLLPEVFVNDEPIADIININDSEKLRKVITNE